MDLCEEDQTMWTAEGDGGEGLMGRAQGTRCDRSHVTGGQMLRDWLICWASVGHWLRAGNRRVAGLTPDR